MGNFYTNFSVRTADVEAVRTLARQQVAGGYLLPAGEWVVVCAVEFEQDIDAATTILNAITGELHTVGFAVLNHDDDVLQLRCSHQGATIFDYLSSPGYFSGEDAPPQIEGLKAMVDHGHVANPFVFQALLSSTKEVFELERHKKVCQALNWPLASVGASAQYIRQGEVPPEVASDAVLELSP
jgi:hypothetical protein